MCVAEEGEGDCDALAGEGQHLSALPIVLFISYMEPL